VQNPCFQVVYTNHFLFSCLYIIRILHFFISQFHCFPVMCSPENTPWVCALKGACVFPGSKTSADFLADWQTQIDHTPNPLMIVSRNVPKLTLWPFISHVMDGSKSYIEIL